MDDVKDDVVTRLDDDERSKVTYAETRLDEVTQNRKSISWERYTD